jgi:hypothetical protein
MHPQGIVPCTKNGASATGGLHRVAVCHVVGRFQSDAQKQRQ